MTSPREHTDRARAMIAAPEALAVDAGADVLARGGNAIDAAVTCAFVQGVVDPHDASVGGFALLMLQRGADQGTAPRQLDAPALAGSLASSGYVGRSLRGGEPERLGVHAPGQRERVGLHVDLHPRGRSRARDDARALGDDQPGGRRGAGRAPRRAGSSRSTTASPPTGSRRHRIPECPTSSMRFGQIGKRPGSS